jgi:hypothetical protein
VTPGASKGPEPVFMAPGVAVNTPTRQLLVDGMEIGDYVFQVIVTDIAKISSEPITTVVHVVPRSTQ